MRSLVRLPRSRGRAPRRDRKGKRAFRPRLEVLEGRCLLFIGEFRRGLHPGSSRLESVGEFGQHDFGVHIE